MEALEKVVISVAKWITGRANAQKREKGKARVTKEAKVKEAKELGQQTGAGYVQEITTPVNAQKERAKARIVVAKRAMARHRAEERAAGGFITYRMVGIGMKAWILGTQPSCSA